MGKVEKYYENPDILHVNTEDARAYYIPFSKAADITDDREKSDRYINLNG